jgi:hypothetical protein
MYGFYQNKNNQTRQRKSKHLFMVLEMNVCFGFSTISDNF